MNDSIVGRTIKDVRPLTDAELELVGWTAQLGARPTDPVYGIVLDDGSVVFASSDYEGNGGGALFGLDAEGPFILAAAGIKE